jgi:hypothetical protein
VACATGRRWKNWGRTWGLEGAAAENADADVHVGEECGFTGGGEGSATAADALEVDTAAGRNAQKRMGFGGDEGWRVDMISKWAISL